VPILYYRRFASLLSFIFSLTGAVLAQSDSKVIQEDSAIAEALSVRVENSSDSPSGSGPLVVEPPRVQIGPELDGILDEDEWRMAVSISNFTQQEPQEGEPATEETVVRLMYTAEALYIGVEAFDSDPAGIIATEKRRDSPRLFDEDNFQIILDTFHDRRSGYMFITNPLGGKLEQQIFEEGEGAW
ncbi:uncharacterized protein METZ01_LOCUS396160, partial [marine metagenome]